MRRRDEAIHKALVGLLHEEYETLDKLYRDAETLMNHSKSNTHRINSYLRAIMNQIDYVESEITSLEREISTLERML